MKKSKISCDKLFIVFLYMQPFLDALAGIMQHYGITISVSSIIRFIFMILCTVYLVFKVKSKRTNIYLIALFTYFALFTINILYYKGMEACGYEIKNMITTYYFVILLTTLLALYRKSKLNVSHLIRIYAIYTILVFIPNILNLGFDSYWHSKEGHVGWFVSANVVGSILSILLPIIILNIKKIDYKIIILLLINLFVIFSIGTKVPVLSFGIVLGIDYLYYIINKFKKHDYKKLIIMILPILLVLISSVIVLPKTSFYKNIVIHINYLKEENNGHISTERFIDHFIFSERLTFEKKTRIAYEKSSIVQKLTGIGYIENYMTDNVRLKTIEIDYFDIYYRHGIIGFIIFFIPVIYSLKVIINKFKYKGLERINIILSITLIFLLALFQGHILITPANSIYVALILSMTANNSFVFKKNISNN